MKTYIENTNSIYFDGLHIPKDPSNRHYQQFLEEQKKGEAELIPYTSSLPAWEQIRIQRDSLLKDSDWIGAIDAQPKPNKEAWLNYRQALRDITKTYLSSEAVIWPTNPGKEYQKEQEEKQKRLEEEQKQKELAAEQERLKLEEQKRLEKQRQKEEQERLRIEEEQKRLKEEQRHKEEQERLRIEQEQKKAEEELIKQKQAEEIKKQQLEEERLKLEAELKALEDSLNNK